MEAILTYIDVAKTFGLTVSLPKTKLMVVGHGIQNANVESIPEKVNILQVAALAPLALLLVLEARCAHFVIAHFNNIVCCGVVHHSSHTSHNIILT